MPPNKSTACYEVLNVVEPPIPTFPAIPEGIPLFFNDNFLLQLPLNTGTDLDAYFQPLPSPEFYSRLNVTIENNLRDLLRQTTGLDNFRGVVKLKLKVITHDMSLQNLSIYTPNLSELDLTGSSVSSLRDLGCGLKNLRILKVNYCGINVLDGLFGLQSVRELHASHNFIRDISPCSFLPEIELIDMSYNAIQELNSLGYLTLCSKLKHMVLEGNIICNEITDYRSSVKNTLKDLETLDKIPFVEEGGIPHLPTLKEKSDKNNFSDNSQPSTSKEPLLPPINDAKPLQDSAEVGNKIKLGNFPKSRSNKPMNQSPSQRSSNVGNILPKVSTPEKAKPPV